MGSRRLPGFPTLRHSAVQHANDSPWSRPRTPPPEAIASVRPSPPTHKPRRRHKLEQLRAQVQWMQHIAIALPLLADADEIWDEFLDRDTKRSRRLLRQLAAVIEDHKTLRRTHDELKMLLAEHSLATRTIRRLLPHVTNQHMDDWGQDGQRWKALARIHYKPWTSEQCAEELDRALQDQHHYEGDQLSTGLSFMGWEDSRRVDAKTSTLYFSFHKTYRDHDLDHQLAEIWNVFTSSAQFTKRVLANRGRAHVDVLQQLTPMLAVILYHERYEGSDSTFHALAILATIEKDNMVMNLIRSIDSPELRNVFGSPDDVWVSKFYWKQFDILDPTKPRSQTDFRASVRGSIGDVNLEYVNLWLFEVLATVIRNEPYTTGRCLLKF